MSRRTCNSFWRKAARRKRIDMSRVIVLLLWVAVVRGQVVFQNGGGHVVIQNGFRNPPPTAGKGVIEGTVIDINSHEPLKKAKVNLGGPPQIPLAAVTDAG